MYKSVHIVLEEHIDKVSTIPAFLKKSNRVKEVLALIRTTDVEIEKFESGIGNAKSSAKRTLANKAYIISQSILEYAEDQNDEELAGSVKFTATQFNRLSDIDLETKARAVYNKLVELLPLLTEQNLKQEDADDLQAAIDLYTSKMNLPRNQIVKRSELNIRQKGYFSEMKKLMKSCDGYALRFKPKYPEFYVQYIKARVIVDRGGSQSSSGTSGSNDPTVPSGETPPPSLMPE